MNKRETLGSLGLIQFCFHVYSILTFSIFFYKKLLLFIYSIIQLLASIFVLFVSILHLLEHNIIKMMILIYV